MRLKPFRLAVVFAVVFIANLTSAEVLVPASLPGGGGSMRGLEDYAPLSNAGTFEHSLPLEVSPGRNGVQPNLRLHYSSGNGNDIVGMGWDFSTPSIQHHPRRVPAYSATASEYYSSEYGELASVGHSYFRPLRGPGSILFYQTKTGSWLQWDQHGNRKIFGEGNARIESRGTTYRWYLSSELDSTCKRDDAPDCNRIEYQYVRASEAQYSPYAFRNSQIYLSTINYNFVGGQPLTTIRFGYRGRPDRILKLRAGFEVLTDRILERVEVETAGKLVWEYQLNYRGNENDAGGFSLLQKFIKKGRNHAEYPEINFSYASARERQIRTSGTQGLPLSELSGKFSPVNYLFMDVNGDGLSDLYWHKNGRAMVAYNSTEAGSEKVMFSPPQSFSKDWTGALERYSSFFADVDGDGILDWMDTSVRPTVRLNREIEWGKPVSGIHFPDFALKGSDAFLIDVNGDGLVDILRRQAQTDTCYLNSGNSAGWQNAQIAPRAERPDPEITSLSLRSRTADINGDGLSDLVLLGHGVTRVWLNRGNCSWAPPFNLSIPAVLEFDLKVQPPENFHWADLDGDGFDDLVGLTKNGIFWSRNSGDGVLIESAMLADSVGTINQLFIGDANGDGSKDIGYCDVVGRCAFLMIRDPQKPGLLRRYETSLGQYAEIYYSPSSAFYTPEWKTKVPFALQIPTLIVRGDYLSERQVSHLNYQNLYFDRFDRRFNGFGEIFSEREPGFFQGLITQPAVSTRQVYSLGIRTDPGDWNGPAEAGHLLSEARGEHCKIYVYKFEALPDCEACRNTSEVQEDKIDVNDGLTLGGREISRYDIHGNPVEAKRYEISSRETHLQSQTVRKYLHFGPEKPATTSDILQSVVSDEVQTGSSGQTLSNVQYTYTNPEIGLPAAEHRYLNERQWLVKLFEYDKVHPKNRSKIWDADGSKISQQIFDFSGINLAESENGEGEKKYFRYDVGTGLPLEEKDGNGLTVEHAYNDRGEEITRLTRHGQKVLGKTAWERVEGSRGVPSAVSETTQLDAKGSTLRKVTYTSPGGAVLQQVGDGPESTARMVVNREYDSNGKLARELLAPAFAKDFGFAPVFPSREPHRVYTYDAMARVRSIQFPLTGTSDDYRYSVISEPVDVIRRRVVVLDRHRNKNQVEYRYDGFDRLTETAYLTPKGAVDRYSFFYDDANNLEKILFPNGDQRFFSWNGQGSLDSLSDSRLGKLQVTYDSRGRLSTRTWSSRLFESNHYDRADRKIKVVRSETGVGREQVIHYVYGKSAEIFNIGLPAEIAYSWGKDEFSYTPDGRVSSKRRIFELPGLTKQFDVKYDFDWIGQTRAIKLGSQTLRFVPDEHGFLHHIPGVIESLHLDARDEPTEIEFANGMTEKLAYDSSTWQLEAVTIVGKDGLQLAEKYERDEIGNVLTKQRNYSASNQAPPSAWLAAYTYDDRDARYRLLNFDQNNIHDRYSYDAIGKRVGEEFTKRFGELQYDSVGRLQGAAHFRSLAYNSASQLEVAHSTAGTRGPVKFLYDYDKTVIAKLIDGRVDSIYIDRALEWQNGAGDLEPVFQVYLNSRPVSSVDYRAKNQLFFHVDHVGSSILVTDERQRVVRVNSYAPYGEIIDEPTGPAASRETGEFAFAGGRFDWDARLYPKGPRHYDPASGQFLTPDPMVSEDPLKLLRDPVQLYPYQYARDNPLSYVDPTGRAAQLVGAAIAGSVELVLQAGLLAMQSYTKNNVTWSDVGVAASQVGLSAAAGGTVAGLGVKFASWTKNAYELGHLTKGAFFASNVAFNSTVGATTSAITGLGSNSISGRELNHNFSRNIAIGFAAGGFGAALGTFANNYLKSALFGQVKPYQFALTDQIDFYPAQFANSMGKFDALGNAFGSVSEKALGQLEYTKDVNK